MAGRLFFGPVLIRVLLFTLVLFAASPLVNAQDPSQQGKVVSRENRIDSGGLGGWFLTVASEGMEKMNEKLSEAGKGLLAIPELIEKLVRKVQDPRTLALWAQMAGKILLVLLAALLAEWLVRRLLGRLRRSIEDREADRFLLRALFLFARTVVDIIPIAVFAVAAYGVLAFMDPPYETRLIALTLVNASVLARIIIAASRLLLVPGVPGLRLWPKGEETIHYLHIWMRRLVGLAVYGYFILEAALLMGMPEGLYVFLMKFLGLSLTAMLVILVMQNKKDVTGWLRRDRSRQAEKHEKEDQARQAGPRVFGVLRRRFADFWHVTAIILIIGVFLTWALEFEGSMMFLFSGLAMTLVVSVLTGLLMRLVDRGVVRLFRISEELKTEHPGLEARANRYQPIISSTLKGAVYVIAVFSILEAWGLGTIGWLFSPMGTLIIGELLTLALIIAAAFLLWEIVSALIERSLARGVEEGRSSTRKLTLLPLLRNAVRIALVMMATMLVLSQIGIDIAPLLAGAGIIGLAIGFGAQTLVRDVITGAFILLEDAISVGDWVEAGGHSGTVERLTVRTLTLRDLAGTVQVVPFGEVTTVKNYNRDYGYALIDAGVAYREKYGDVVQALQDVAVELSRDETWGPDIIGDLEVFGLNNLGDSAVEIRVRLKTRPMRQFGVRRAFLEKMKRTFDERGIEIPFPHRTIWFGADKDGTAPPMFLAKESHKALERPGPQSSAKLGAELGSEPGASEDAGEGRNQASAAGRSGDRAT
jgi:moderate conductance mechanosensitive channel